MFGKVRVSGQSVPPGIYTGTFEGVEPVPPNVEKGYASAFKFTFKVIEGEHAGSLATRIPSGEAPTLKNGLSKFLGEITGITVTPEVDYDTEIGRFFGQKYTLVVKESPNGGTRVETVIRIK